MRLIGTRRRRHEIELQNGLTPTTVLLHHVFDDFADQGQRPIGLLDSEQRHGGRRYSVNSWVVRVRLVPRSCVPALLLRLPFFQSAAAALLGRGVPAQLVFSLRL